MLSETKALDLQCGGAEERRDVRDEVCRKREKGEREREIGSMWGAGEEEKQS